MAIRITDNTAQILAIPSTTRAVDRKPKCGIKVGTTNYRPTAGNATNPDGTPCVTYEQFLNFLYRVNPVLIGTSKIAAPDDDKARGMGNDTTSIDGKILAEKLAAEYGIRLTTGAPAPRKGKGKGKGKGAPAPSANGHTNRMADVV